MNTESNETPKEPIADKAKVKKNAPLSHEMKMFIQSHVYDPTWTDEKFAKELKVNAHAVSLYRRKEGLKRSAGEVNISTADLTQKIKSTQNIEEKKNLHKVLFMHSARFARLKTVFDPHDLVLVTDKWLDYKLQLPDMTASEEDILEKILILDLRILYNQKAMQVCQSQQNAIRSQMTVKSELDPDNDKDLMLMQLATTKNGEEIEINKQYAILLKEYNSLLESLNATRKQREEKFKVGATTFFDLVKDLNNKEMREQIGKINEYQKRAMMKKTSDLKKPHQYMDGAIDVPILDGEDFKKNAVKIDPDAESNKPNEEDSTNNGG